MSGRKLRSDGARRRLAVLEGALDVIAEHGVEGLTHRRVAESAGLSLSVTTYYFATLEDLLVAAMRLATERDTEMLRERLAGVGPEELPGIFELYIAAARSSGRRSAIVGSELYVAAVRRPALGELVALWEQAWIDALHPLVGDAALAVSSAVGGLMGRALALDDATYSAAETSTAVRAMLRGLVPVTPEA